MLRRAFSRLMFVAAVAFVLGCGVQPASAQSLDQLRASGAVGERFDGFAQALDGGASALVDQVNAKRRDIYAKAAAQEGVAVDQIGRVYAKQIFQQAPAGTKFLQENGKWMTK